jgi:hypothetical protein
MARLKIDHADRAVKQFARTLRLHRQGLEVELNGRVLFRIVPPAQLSEVEKAALLQQGKQLVRRARARNRGVPTVTIAKEVRQAVQRVRGKN